MIMTLDCGYYDGSTWESIGSLQTNNFQLRSMMVIRNPEMNIIYTNRNPTGHRVRYPSLVENIRAQRVERWQ